MVPFICLPLDEQQVHRKPPPIGEGHDLGIAASACFAHGLLVCATRRIGGTLMNHHMSAIHQPDTVFEMCIRDRVLEGPLPLLASLSFVTALAPSKPWLW